MVLEGERRNVSELHRSIVCLPNGVRNITQNGLDAKNLENLLHFGPLLVDQTR